MRDYLEGQAYQLGVAHAVRFLGTIWGMVSPPPMGYLVHTTHMGYLLPPTHLGYLLPPPVRPQSVFFRAQVCVGMLCGCMSVYAHVAYVFVGADLVRV